VSFYLPLQILIWRSKFSLAVRTFLIIPTQFTLKSAPFAPFTTFTTFAGSSLGTKKVKKQKKKQKPAPSAYWSL